MAGLLTSCPSLSSPPAPETTAVALAPESAVLTSNSNSGQSWSLAAYRNPATQATVVEFYERLTRRPSVARAILHWADVQEIDLSLAFALAQVESHFNPEARSRNPVSEDFGLFQLNSKVYPQLSLEEAFDPETNARLGLAHLKDALRQGQLLTRALAIYNAGSGRVRAGGTPFSTLAYIDRILLIRRDFDSQLTRALVLGSGPLLTSKTVKDMSGFLDRARRQG